MHIYNEQIALHYAAYRPPLHRLILDEVLNGRQFETGLDIGCGTGYSAIALLEYCEHVMAVDCSQAMLASAIENPDVTYFLGRGEELPIEDASVDVATFAGVLSYLDTQAIVSELKRVCRPGSIVVPYDFEIILDDILQQFSLPDIGMDETYDHACSLADGAGISTLDSVARVIDLNMSAQQLAHIVLSEKARYDLLVDKFQTPDPFDQVVERIEQANWTGSLDTKIYFSIHEFKTNRRARLSRQQKS